MAIKIVDAGVTRTITAGKVRVAGITRNLLSIKVMDGGTLRTVATFVQPMSVSLSASSVSGASQNDPIYTGSTTATPSGGKGPYSYAWTIQSFEGVESTALYPSMSSTGFTKSVPDGDTETDVWRVTVTDSLGSTATATVSARFTNIPGGGVQ